MKTRLLLLIISYLCSSIVGNAQVIVDYQLLNLEEGTVDRLVKYVTRDSFGYFYATSEGSIQRFDGKNFVDLNLQELHANNTSLHDLKGIDLGPDQNIYLKFPISRNIYFIKPASLQVSSLSVNTPSSIVGHVGEQFLVTERNGDKYDLYAYPSGFGTKRLIFRGLSSQPDKVVWAYDHYYIQDVNKSLYELREDEVNPLKKKGIVAVQNEQIRIFANDGIYILADGKMSSIYQHEGEERMIKFINQDKKGNILATYSLTVNKKYCQDLLLLKTDNSITRYDNILLLNKIFLDCYGDDFESKLVLVGHKGFSPIIFLKKGAELIDFRPLDMETFGHVIAGITSYHDSIIVYNHEAKGVFSYEPNKGSKPLFNLESKQQFFLRNQRMYYSKYLDKVVMHSYEFNDNSQLYLINPLSKKEFHSYPIPFRVLDILPQGDKIYLAGYNGPKRKGELGYFDLTNNQYYPIINDHPNYLFNLFYLEDQETFWVGSNRGLQVYDSSFRLLQEFGKNKLEHQSMKHDYTRVVKLNHDGKVLIGTVEGGLYVVDPAIYKIEHIITEVHGLTNNNVIAMEYDLDKNLWLATWNGITVLDTNYQVIKTLFLDAGLPNKEFNTKSSAKDNYGNLYFGSINGMIKINPREVLKWKESKGMHITDFVIHKEFSEQRVEELVLKNSFDSISFRVNQPDYYAYKFVRNKIKGFLSGKGEINVLGDLISLKNLATGNTNLTLTNDETQRSMMKPIVISHDYGLLFNILGIVGLVALLSYIIIYRNRISEQKKTKLNQDIARLQLTGLQKQMNPHFIFNALGSIQYFIQTNENDRADEYLSKFASLMRLTLESSKSKFISLDKELKLLEQYIQLEKLRFEDNFEYKIEVDSSINRTFDIPPMIVQPFVENAINHGLVNLKGRSGLLELKVTKVNNSCIKFIVQDDGIGRKASFAQKKNKGHISRGTQIIDERITTFNATKDMRIELEIEDLTDTEGNSTGTKIHLLFVKT